MPNVCALPTDRQLQFEPHALAIIIGPDKFAFQMTYKEVGIQALSVCLSHKTHTHIHAHENTRTHTNYLSTSRPLPSHPPFPTLFPAGRLFSGGSPPRATSTLTSASSRTHHPFPAGTAPSNSSTTPSSTATTRANAPSSSTACACPQTKSGRWDTKASYKSVALICASLQTSRSSTSSLAPEAAAIPHTHTHTPVYCLPSHIPPIDLICT